VLLHLGLAAAWSILGNGAKPFVTSFQSRGVYQSAVKCNTGIIFLFLDFCGTWDKELGKIRNEGRNMNE